MSKSKYIGRYFIYLNQEETKKVIFKVTDFLVYKGYLISRRYSIKILYSDVYIYKYIDTMTLKKIRETKEISEEEVFAEVI